MNVLIAFELFTKDCAIPFDCELRTDMKHDMNSGHNVPLPRVDQSCDAANIHSDPNLEAMLFARHGARSRHD